MFSPGAELERNANVLIERLMRFVQTHSSGPPSRSWSRRSDWENELPPRFEMICICPPLTEGGSWQCSHFGDILPLAYEDLANRVAQKNNRLSSYRSKAAVNWLLLVADFIQQGTLSVPREAESWTFVSGFEKIFLFSREHGRVLDIGA